MLVFFMACLVAGLPKLSNHFFSDSYRTPVMQDQNIPGAADTAWDFGGYVVPPITGSYGFNSWLYSFAPAKNFGDAATYPAYLFPNPASIQRVSQTPLFFDAIWVQMQPLESDQPANNLYTGTWINTTMGCCTILRHGGKTASSSYPFSGQRQALPGAINMGFCDGHAQLVNLRDLWGYYWHYNWQPPP